jgi:hypothetical protein
VNSGDPEIRNLQNVAVFSETEDVRRFEVSVTTFQESVKALEGVSET